MPAPMIDHADPAVGRAETQEILAQDAKAHRGAACDQLAGKRERNPIFADQLAHRRIRANLRQKLILVSSHCTLLGFG